jgi:hypothetical protein
MGAALGKASVKIIAGLPGLTRGYGGTHQAIEDLALLRAVPNLVVINPCDATEITQAVAVLAEDHGPVYMRQLHGQVSIVLDPATYRFSEGERLYTLEEFERLTRLRAADIVQMDPAHFGGLLMSKKIAALAEAEDLRISPHCSIGPVALCAALHLDWSTPNAFMQENFAEFDVPWRNDLVGGWNPVRTGELALPQGPGLGIELHPEVCAAHPYKKNSFPSLWDSEWLQDSAQNKQT